MVTRRAFLAGTTVLAWAGCARGGRPASEPVVVNDVHSRLNASRVARVARPDSTAAVARTIREARERGEAVSIAGGRHAMGGQQFGAGTTLVDTRALGRVLGLDRERGLVDVEAGIQWPALMDWLRHAQPGDGPAWGIAQKQTGADRLSLGGALAANVHGRGLALRPFVADVEAITLVDGDGAVRRCSRTEHAELFRLAAGGYGLAGVVTRLTLRLARRRKVERVVEVIDVDTLPGAFAARIAEGYLFGDFQFATDPAAPEFLRRGVFSCYRPVDDRRAMPATVAELGVDDWQRLLVLAHVDKRRAFESYAAYYRSTSGQLYWSDTHQLSLYLDDYHVELDRRLGATVPGTEMISEIYVPREALPGYMADVARAFRPGGADVVYGTVRLIERDDESLLAWARQPWACIIFNLHVVHTPDGLARAADHFRQLIDLALARGGSYYLTYHRWATRRQVEAAHPRFVEFLRAKRAADPAERFQSDWYRHYRAMFADAL